MAKKNDRKKPAVAKKSASKPEKQALKIADVTAENVLPDNRAKIEKSIADLYKSGKIDLESTEIRIPELNVEGSLQFHMVSAGLQIIFRGN